MHQIFKIFFYIFQLYSIITERKNIAFLYLIEFLSSGVLLLPSQLHIEKLYLTCVIIGKLYIIIWRFGRCMAITSIPLLWDQYYFSLGSLISYKDSTLFHWNWKKVFNSLVEVPDYKVYLRANTEMHI